jgi:hypothetical protein
LLNSITAGNQPTITSEATEISEEEDEIDEW